MCNAHCFARAHFRIHIIHNVKEIARFVHKRTHLRKRVNIFSFGNVYFGRVATVVGETPPQRFPRRTGSAPRARESVRFTRSFGFRAGFGRAGRPDETVRRIVFPRHITVAKKQRSSFERRPRLLLRPHCDGNVYFKGSFLSGFPAVSRRLPGRPTSGRAADRTVVCSRENSESRVDILFSIRFRELVVAHSARVWTL